MKEKLRRGMLMPLLASVLALGAFLRIPGSENVRVVQMLALIAIGMGLGVALAHIRILLGMKSDQ
ncbi:MAG TPA: hypothetical protein VLK33_19175 [Terriglobales bacterium]|nr:hypothetical protein [Terriglobales bacterium]